MIRSKVSMSAIVSDGTRIGREDYIACASYQAAPGSNINTPEIFQVIFQVSPLD